MLVEKTGRYKFRAVGTGLPNVRDSVPTARTTAHNYIFYSRTFGTPMAQSPILNLIALEEG